MEPPATSETEIRAFRDGLRYAELNEELIRMGVLARGQDRWSSREALLNRIATLRVERDELAARYGLEN